MMAYAIRRIALMLPTLFAIMVVNFFIVQAAPGGPIQQMISKLKGTDIAATERVSGVGGELRNQPSNTQTQYRGARGLDPAFIKELEKQYGFDKPPLERFVLMLKNYATFDFGSSFFRDRRVVDLIRDKLPVSISIGLWTTLLTYLISIPLGIRKAVRDGSRFDVWTSAVIIFGYAVPSFLFAVLLIVLFIGALLIEVIVLLDVLGLLAFETATNRDFPIVFGALYVFTLIGLVLKLVSDLTSMLIDPQIDFGRR